MATKTWVALWHHGFGTEPVFFKAPEGSSPERDEAWDKKVAKACDLAFEPQKGEFMEFFEVPEASGLPEIAGLVPQKMGSR